MKSGKSGVEQTKPKPHHAPLPWRVAPTRGTLAKVQDKGCDRVLEETAMSMITTLQRKSLLALDYRQTEMCHRSIQTILVALILTGHVLTPGGLPGTSVLCYGADGHVAVEPAGQPCANPSRGDMSSNTMDHEDGDAHCEPCVDIPLPVKTDHVPASRSSQERSPLTMAVVLAQLFTYTDVYAAAPRSSPASSVPLSAGDPCAALRTIVLRV